MSLCLHMRVGFLHVFCMLLRVLIVLVSKRYLFYLINFHC
ncbi:hypothetical protein HMPREF1573_00342 [Gardnerella vaginalis JCP7276]|nr:hypothetical protein HMPREF1573_00342 [Gardnerella vaginalis JCP7276]